MDFQLNEEQLQLKKSVREFAEREIRPNVMKWDEAGEFPLATIKELGKLGLLGMIFPPEYGGAGMGYVEYVTAIEELSRVDGSVGIIVAAHTSLCSNHIFLAGNEAQKKKYVSKLATGEFIGAWGLDRAFLRIGRGQRAHDRRPQRQQLGAERHQDFLHQRPLRRRCGRDRRDRPRRAHPRAFRIHRGERNQGFSSRQERKQARPARQRHCRTDLRRLRHSCRESAAASEGEGFIDAMRVLDGGRISIAALSLGMAEGAYEAALKYSKQRKQFGKAISDFQAIQWKLADMATEIDAAKLLTMRAASMKDAGMKTTLESSMAKLYASEVAVRCANEGVQIHGGYGFIKDYPAEKFYRDVKLCTIGEGTSEIQRLVIARQLLKD